jgi:hypothetical protein
MEGIHLSDATGEFLYFSQIISIFHAIRSFHMHQHIIEMPQRRMNVKRKSFLYLNIRILDGRSLLNIFLCDRAHIFMYALVVAAMCLEIQFFSVCVE